MTTVLLGSILLSLEAEANLVTAPSAVPELYSSDHTARSGRSVVAPEDGVTRLNVKLNLSALSADEIRLNPFPELDVIAYHQKTTFGVGGSFVWQGTLADEPFSEVYFSFNQGLVVGKITRGTGEVYRLTHDLDGSLVEVADLSQQETSTILSEEPPIVAAATQELRSPSTPLSVSSIQNRQSTRALSSNGSIITLMILYTPLARDTAGGVAAIESEINLAVAEANQAAINSQLNFSFLVVHTGLISADESINYAGGLINQILSNDFPEVKTLRDQHAADIVSIVTQTKPSIAFQLDEMDLREEASAYNQVNRSSGIFGRVLAHEIGHNMGAGHGRGPWPLAADLGTRIHPYAFGHGDDSTGLYTIMGAGLLSHSNPININYFSSPNVYTNSLPVGTAYSATTGYGEDNARVLNETAYMISNYRISPSTDQTLEVDTLVDDWRLIDCLDGVIGDCSLRGAIRLASADVTTRPYTITLPLNQTYLITATSSLHADDDYAVYGDYDVRGNITIEGNGSTIDGNQLSRVFHVLGNDSSLTLRYVTIQGGKTETGGGISVVNDARLVLQNSHVISNTSTWYGGGIYATGETLIENSTVQNNVSIQTGGGISQITGKLSVTDSVISGNTITPQGHNAGGGGIASGGVTTITRSTFMSNTAELHGSGILAWGALTVLSSTFRYNQAPVTSAWPSAIFADSHAVVSDSVFANNVGGLAVRGYPLEVINSTISGNDKHGIWLFRATAAITHTTIVSNSRAGIHGDVNQPSSQFTIQGSLVAHHGDGSCQGNLGVNTSQGYNLLGDNSCGFTATGDVVNSNTLLQPLALNGGLTLNHSPAAGSPALDQIPAGNCQLTTDQRGLSRPFNTNCDKGAVESHAETTPISPSLLISVTAGTDVNLSWAAESANCNHTVYRSSHPYASFTLLATTHTAPYVDPNVAGNAGVNYFYLVTASSCPAGAQTADSKTMGAFNFALLPGN